MMPKTLFFYSIFGAVLRARGGACLRHEVFALLDRMPIESLAARVSGQPHSLQAARRTLNPVVITFLLVFTKSLLIFIQLL